MKTIEQLENELETEREHSEFLETLIAALYGDGWKQLTISEAERLKELGRMRDNQALKMAGFCDECGFDKGLCQCDRSHKIDAELKCGQEGYEVISDTEVRCRKCGARFPRNLA